MYDDGWSKTKTAIVAVAAIIIVAIVIVGSVIGVCYGHRQNEQTKRACIAQTNRQWLSGNCIPVVKP